MKLKPESLADAERAEIAAMMESPGWRILKDKVIPQYAEIYREICTRSRADIRYHQGFYQGFRWAQSLVEKMADREPDTPELYFPKETDLKSRRSGSLM